MLPVLVVRQIGEVRQAQLRASNNQKTVQNINKDAGTCIYSAATIEQRRVWEALEMSNNDLLISGEISTLKLLSFSL